MGLEELWAEVTPPAARKLLIAATHAFAERGYHATTTRDVASRAGMSPAAVYIHYPTKEDLLFHISRLGHRGALDVLNNAATSSDDPAQCLQVAVREFAGWHARFHTTGRVVQYELSALAPAHFGEIVEFRREIERTMRAVVDRGIRSGQFTVADPAGTTLAILSLCIDVARWFRADGKRSPAQIGEVYAELVTRMVGATQ
ncbi:TetR/AcrR family transcriptional regulator [Saccharopolyspora shandongensis]|uniref:TetR/AcrR family transcriptional regulator n=1 Tax=Saccharopolyspora shandongensis TaxID=418495 RepID=UPI0034214918